MELRLLCIAAILVACLSAQTAAPASRAATYDAKPYWAGIVVADADASAAWYEVNLHFTITKEMNLPEHRLRIVFLDFNGFTLELIESKDSVSVKDVKNHIPALKDRDKLQGFIKLGFLVHDVDVLAAELKRKGVKLAMEPTDDPPFGTKFFLVEDNDGNVLQFFQFLK